MNADQPAPRVHGVPSLERGLLSRRSGVAAALLLLLVLVGCDSGTDLPPVLSVHEVQFHSSLGVDLSQMEERPSGLWIRDEVEGASDAPQAATDTEVAVHYTGWLPDGMQFDSSEGGSPLRFVPDEGRLIQGFTEGVLGMREGGQRLLLIPPHLGYGAEGAGGGVIPPNSWLVFRITLEGR